jgi:hypothetical protein
MFVVLCRPNLKAALAFVLSEMSSTEESGQLSKDFNSTNSTEWITPYLRVESSTSDLHQEGWEALTLGLGPASQLRATTLWTSDE